ncbi:MAG: hypothetical protein ACLQDY_00540 [Streptosporangiaceae bacterium]|jgi:hypothetical protein
MARKTRIELRQERMRRRLAEADTPLKEMNAAFDWLRSSLEYLGKRGTRSEGARGTGYPATVRITAQVRDFLAAIAADIDEGGYYGGDDRA